MLPSHSLCSREHQIYGSLSLFPLNVLPTNSDVLKRLLYSKENLMTTTGKKYIPVNEIVKPVIADLIVIWEKASIPTVSYDGIRKNLTKFWE